MRILVTGRHRLPCLRLLALAAAFCCARSAHAFEGPWHLGLGGGVTAPAKAYRAGPALSLHAGYGLSDVFDATLDVSSSWQRATASEQPAVELASGSLGLAYKLDIIEWVPYLGVRAGYFRFSSTPAAPYARDGGLLGVMAGLDYSFSRDFALGAEVGYDMLLPAGRRAGALLRAEYRFGY